MPRLSHSLLHRAHSISSRLPVLLQQTRSLSAALAELRWLRSHARKIFPHNRTSQRSLLRSFVKSRGKGVPLQYVLGTEYFGDLELRVRKGVLIPRWETASLISHLSTLLSNSQASLPRPLKILDLCTGSGCISLLLSFLLSPAHATKILGIDISPSAIDLSNNNLQHSIQTSQLPLAAKEDVRFKQADILSPSFITQALITESNRDSRPGRWDILVSNPPYISPRGFAHSTARSVRNHEPRLALVPPSSQQQDREDGVAFYAPLLAIAETVGAKVVLFELGDELQARLIVAMGLARSWKAEVWRDCPEFSSWSTGAPAAAAADTAPYSPGAEDHWKEEEEEEEEEKGIEGEKWVVNVYRLRKEEVEVKGRGKVRGILFWKDGGVWTGKREPSAI